MNQPKPLDSYRRNFEIFKNLIWLNLVLLKFLFILVKFKLLIQG
jgi:hypothetical protein